MVRSKNKPEKNRLRLGCLALFATASGRPPSDSGTSKRNVLGNRRKATGFAFMNVSKWLIFRGISADSAIHEASVNGVLAKIFQGFRFELPACGAVGALRWQKTRLTVPCWHTDFGDDPLTIIFGGRGKLHRNSPVPARRARPS